MISILCGAAASFVVLISLIIYRELRLEQRHARSCGQSGKVRRDDRGIANGRRRSGDKTGAPTRGSDRQRVETTDPRFENLALLEQIEPSVDDESDWADETTRHVYSERWG